MSSSVHCNFCGEFPSPQCTSFCLSNCGHVFCKQCIDAGRLSVKCNRCGAATPKVVAIDRNLNPNLQLMFKNLGQLVEEHEKEHEPIMKFQSNQRTMRFKGQLELIRQEKTRRIEAENQLTITRDEMKRMQQKDHEKNRSRHSSRDSARSLSRGGDVSDSSHVNHTMSSSVSSNETSYLDPFKTPTNGLKRFTTSTPKAIPPTMEVPRPKKNKSSRLSHNSTTTSFAMEVDDEVMDVTPSTLRAPLKNGPSTASLQQNVIKADFDAILSDVPKKQLPKTPHPSKKNTQSRLTMAEHLSVTEPAARPLVPETPQTQLLKKKKKQKQPEVTSSSTTPVRAASVQVPKQMEILQQKYEEAKAAGVQGVSHGQIDVYETAHSPDPTPDSSRLDLKKKAYASGVQASRDRRYAFADGQETVAVTSAESDEEAVDAGKKKKKEKKTNEPPRKRGRPSLASEKTDELMEELQALGVEGVVKKKHATPRKSIPAEKLKALGVGGVVKKKIAAPVSVFKTPAMPVKKTKAVPRTMPAGTKKAAGGYTPTAAAGSAAAFNTPQPHL